MIRWSLPGPDRFLGAVVDDLHNDGAVVVRLPTTLDVDDVWAEVARRLPYTMVDHIDTAIAAANVAPADVVAEQVGVPGRGWTAARLAASEDVEGRVLCIVGLERLGAGAAAWTAWVSEFVSASATNGEFGRSAMLLVVVAGPSHGSLPPAGPLVREHWWWGVADRLDVAVHIKQLAPELDTIDREQIVEVAGGDFVLVERLVEDRCRDETEIAASCIERARELALKSSQDGRGWRPDSPARLEFEWGSGAVDVFDGRLHWHAGVLAAQGNGGLRRRLWTAQVRSLLPIVDLLRLDLIEIVKRHQLLPCHLLTDDLEVAELARRLRHVGHEHQLSDLADWLRRCRNDLAHLKVVPSSIRDEGRALAMNAGIGRE